MFPFSVFFEEKGASFFDQEINSNLYTCLATVAPTRIANQDNLQ